jgi:hypothetical protein
LHSRYVCAIFRLVNGAEIMPKNAALSLEELCYDRPMKEIVSPDVAKRPGSSRKPRTKKHIATPLTADQISKRVGVTKKDAALVTKVLLELGYLREEKPTKGKTTPPRARRPRVGSKKS